MQGLHHVACVYAYVGAACDGEVLLCRRSLDDTAVRDGAPHVGRRFGGANNHDSSLLLLRAAALPPAHLVCRHITELRWDVCVRGLRTQCILTHQCGLGIILNCLFSSAVGIRMVQASHDG